MDEYYSQNSIGAFDLLAYSYALVLPTLHVQPNLTEPYNPHQVMMEGASMLHSGMFEGVVSDPLCYHQNQVQGLMDSSSHLQGSTTIATANLVESVEYWDRMLSSVDDTAIMEPQASGFTTKFLYRILLCFQLLISNGCNMLCLYFLSI